MQKEEKNLVKQEQIHDIIYSREIGWQEIIYDLINTEQLDPWDINITILTDSYLKKIQEIEETDFFISSKVLLAAALLLRIKSEILLNKYIKSIDEILFGKKQEKKYEPERIDLDEEIPELVPKSPVPRFKKVTLQELMQALDKAITTENRRIRKEIISRNALREASISLPKKKISIKDKIKEIYSRLFNYFEKNKKHKKISFTDFAGKDKEAKILSFSPLLHLETQKKVFLEQNTHFDEVNIWLSSIYLKHNPDPIKLLAKEIEAEYQKELTKEQKKRLKLIQKKFKNPLGKE